MACLLSTSFTVPLCVNKEFHELDYALSSKLSWKSTITTVAVQINMYYSSKEDEAVSITSCHWQDFYITHTLINGIDLFTTLVYICSVFTTLSKPSLSVAAADRQNLIRSHLCPFHLLDVITYMIILHSNIIILRF
ncbi:hypothetical protein P8452_43180 [Trifolium repens]|nr:hypothetical protein P8452_43180 [Trifolium repens]